MDTFSARKLVELAVREVFNCMVVKEKEKAEKFRILGKELKKEVEKW